MNEYYAYQYYGQYVYFLITNNYNIPIYSVIDSCAVSICIHAC